ncbi:MAG: adenylate/guanylate cyclase domain-containing protein, partial [Candidatus Eisenbacteria bacterium]
LEAVTSAEARASRVLVTLLFTDIVGSTERAAALGDRAWLELIEAHHTTVRQLFARFNGREVDCAGDGFFATFATATSAIGCGDAITESVRLLGLEVRAGLHTGECEHLDGRVRGIAVHTAARLARLAQPGEVLVTATVRDVVAGSGIRFEDRGARTLKGIPGLWRLYAVASGDQRAPDTPVVPYGRRDGRRSERSGWQAGPRTAAYSGTRTVRNG